jgi:hypothetical protein
MTLEALLASLAPAYEIVRGRRGVLAADPAAREALAAVGFGPDGGECLAPSDLSGRSPLGSIEVAGERWIVRRFHHGGAFRSLGQRAFPGPTRPFRECLSAQRLAAAGISTPRVVAARAVRDTVGWRLALVTVRIEGVADGAQWLERWRAGQLDRTAKRRLTRLWGALVGDLHRVGFEHVDLHPRNLLVSEDLEQVHVIDLDRGRHGPLDDGARRRNLTRLLRAVRRREARGRAFLSRPDHLRFLRAYGHARGSDTWKADWRAVVARQRRTGPWHRLGWLVEERLGSGPEQRDGDARVPDRDR